MAIITISIDDEVEKAFRETAKKCYSGKGYLGKAITEALRMWINEKQQNKIAEEEIARLRKGYKMGGYLFKTRDELHER